MSRRQTIREAWKALLETTGYPVGMGKLPAPGPGDPPVAIVLRFADVVRIQGRKKFHTTTASIEALTESDLDQSWVAVEELVAAIKTAVETDSREIGGVLVDPVSERDIESEPGSTVAGTVLSYQFQWAETWGDPS